jgi:hypothetical protein
MSPSTRKASGVDTRYDQNPLGADNESEIARLAAEVYRAVRQTVRVNQAVTQVVAEMQSLTGEVDVLAAEVGALAAERDQGRCAKVVPVARSAPDGESSR